MISCRLKENDFSYIFIECVAAELGLPEIAAHHWSRHPLSYLMEAADDICYALLDLEDAVELGLLDDREVENVLQGMVHIDKLWPEQGG